MHSPKYSDLATFLVWYPTPPTIPDLSSAGLRGAVPQLASGLGLRERKNEGGWVFLWPPDGQFTSE